ncbi:protein-tyrosine-phosphatase [Roseateles chitinivorans]|uniref:protein-tyrosine-phosphatase n=2 Tax=Roseateles chitinivorans TaxID=2917965 RepID=A0A2G9C2C4_9BURK|nr:protein-tyrosine-phosphatase [Roseateles chitinivorans]
MAEAVLRLRAGELGLTGVASAGVFASSRAHPVDKRALAVLEQRGYGMDRRWRSRKVSPEDFDTHDLILAMDRQVLRGLRAMKPAVSPARLGLFLAGMTGLGLDEVPDPYYGAGSGFVHVLDLIEARVHTWPRDVTVFHKSVTA